MIDPLIFDDYKASGYAFDNVFGVPLNIVGGNQNSNGDLEGFLLRGSVGNQVDSSENLGFISGLLDFIAPDNYDPNAVVGSPNSVSGTWVDRYIKPSSDDDDESGMSFGTKALVTVGVIVIGVVAVRALVKKI